MKTADMSPKQVRKALGLTQAQMAAVCNIHIATIKKWEAKAGCNVRKPGGPAERLLQILLDLNAKADFKAYCEKYIDA